jgi:hydrogenase/urease accessory protein HupE
MKLRLFLMLWLSLGLLDAPQADIVKPALVEISANTNGEVNIEVRASIEALLTGINAQYKNTQDAPTAEEYDELRVLQAEQLQEEFNPFKPVLLSEIFLKADDVVVPLEIVDVSIPEPGYTKVPRISVINLRGKLDPSVTRLQWYYPASFGDNAVRVRQVDEENELWHWSEWQWLRNDQPSEPFSLEEIFTRRPITEVVLSYAFIGFEHIVPKGTDHILFILGIFLLSTRMKPLLWQVTMFTVAHTLTLALSMKGIINLPSNIVEPLIALSIAYVGIENIFAHSLHKSRLVLVFLFGLLHGMGFAGVLAEFGMPPNAFATALISFNIGVELGQIAVIFVAYLAVGLWFRKKTWYHQFVTIPGSLVISAIGLYWTWDRIVL